MPRTLIIPLEPPIDAGKGAKVTELRLREPTLAEMERSLAAGTPYAQILKLIAAVSGLDEVVASRIPASYRGQAAEFFQSFMPPEGAETDEAAPPPSPFVLTLEEPIVFGRDTHEALTLREPTLGELDKAMRHPAAIRQMILLTSQTAGVPLPVAERVGVSRLREIAAFFRPFR